MKITIAGTPGSGKGTLARDLSRVLGLKHYHIGDFRREMARKKGISLAQLNKLGEDEDWTDREADAITKKVGETEDDFVIDGWMAWYFVPDSIKIFLGADEEVRAKRILSRPRPEEEFKALEKVKKANRERIENSRLRYRKYYNADPFDKSHYDIVLDSTGKKPEETLKEALKEIEKHKA